MRKTPSQERSETAQRIALLVDLLGGGSQRGFAKIVGCSHAAIAKIVKGEHEPGKDILARIGEAPQVNQDWLMTGEGEALIQQTQKEDRRVPVAESLLPGLPSANMQLLSSQSELVPASVFKESLYVVDAVACVPAYDDPEEHFLPGDRLLIDANPKRWTGNLQSLHDKLCVTTLGNAQDAFVTMRRVQVTFSLKQQCWTISACQDEHMQDWIRRKAEMRQEMEDDRRFRRVISLGPASQLADSQQFFEVIPSAAIVGKAIRLLRDL